MVLSSPRGSAVSSPSLQTDTTRLVQALIHFGEHGEYDGHAGAANRSSTAGGDTTAQHDDDEQDSDLDNEQEQVTVAGKDARSVHQEPSSSDSSKGRQPVHEHLNKLSLNEDSPHAEKPKPKPPKSLRSLLRSSEHSITLASGGQTTTRVLTSWKMADYAYKREPCPFPTRARGLFTERIDDGNSSEEQYRIVARGYDKFFNVNEVSWTHWDAIPKQSSPPYELTLKSNGCIILIAALTPSHILVTSKHSVGAKPGGVGGTVTDVSHSQRGEWWLEKHLEKIGKKKEDLAKELWDRGLTAVAELCDDSFEEHVLAYPSHLTGLHLHGLNTNTPILHTLPSSQVTAFAKAWGLIPTPFTIFPSVLAVRTYCETVESCGGVQEDDGSITPVEGFVVRGVKKGSNRTPSTDGHNHEPFFWKVKYDDPYLMYREWRELTRKLLSSYPDLSGVNPNKLKNEQSRLYLWWVKREIEQRHENFESWKHGKGIIKTREEFLRWKDSEEGRRTAKEVLKLKMEVGSEAEKPQQDNRDFDRTLVVPIAVQGCGKTVLGLELSKLFGWAHTQSDDFHMKKSGPHFVKSVKELLQTHGVVFADKNNHQKKLRSDLVDAAHSLSASHRTRLVAILYRFDTPELPRDKLHELCASRILSRGDRHQTLRPDLVDDPRAHEQAVWQFLGQYEKFEPALNAADGAFDAVLEIGPEWSRREQVVKVIEGLIEAGVPGVSMPSEEKLQQVIEWAKTYEPEKKKVVAKEVVEKKKAAAAKAKPRYYGVKVDTDLKSIVEEALARTTSKDQDLWTALVASNRVEKHPHVTLVHENEVKLPAPASPSTGATPSAPSPAATAPNEATRLHKKALWDRYADLVKKADTAGASTLDVSVTLGPKIAWDSRAMAIEVSQLKGGSFEIEMPSEALQYGSGGDGDRRIPHAHVTVGTKEDKIRPVEGKWLLEAVLKGEKTTKEGGEITIVDMGKTVTVTGSLAGLK